MSNFMEDLWTSVFTAGPTPTLLVATNVTFAALQFLLLSLLLATYSLHFFALSLISGGLWWSINWFAAEVRAAHAEQEAQKEREKLSTSTDNVEVLDDRADGEDTETEGLAEANTASALKASSLEGRGIAGETTGARLTVDATARKRRSLADSSGDVSTDSEWEKVEDDGK